MSCANGLRFPIVVRDVPNEDGEIEQELVDVAIAGVDPVFTVFEGDNEAVRAYIADVNLERRDLKKGQKAMALAMLYSRARDRRSGQENCPETGQFRGE